MNNEEQLKRELRDMVNWHGVDTAKNLPDHVIADYLYDCLDELDAFNIEVPNKVSRSFFWAGFLAGAVTLLIWVAVFSVVGRFL